MSYEYILTFDNENAMNLFFNNVAEDSLAFKDGNNINFSSPDSNSQWNYDVRLVKLSSNKCLVQVAIKSDLIFTLFKSSLMGINFNVLEDGDEEHISLEMALKPGRAL